MKLIELDAKFIGNVSDTGFAELLGIDQAQGVIFQCPKCGEGKEKKAGYVVGAHYVICWFANPRNAPVVPPTLWPKVARWRMSGSSISNLTLSPSVFLNGEGGCQWHGYVRNGDAA